MIRTFFTSTAIAALISTGAFAAQDMKTQNITPVFKSQNQSQDQSKNMGYYANEKGQTLASTLIGKSIYNGSYEESDRIGEVNDLLLADDGSVKAVIVGVGGFIGINQKEVAVDFSRLNWAIMEDDQVLVMNTSTAELEEAPAYNKQTTMADARAYFERTAGMNNANTIMLDVANVSADKLIGSSIEGANGSDLGDVGDVILAADEKTIDSVIVDVGGFLGLGTKPVAVKMSDLQIMQNQDEELIIKTSLTQQQLEQAVEYKK